VGEERDEGVTGRGHPLNFRPATSFTLFVAQGWFIVE